MVLVRRFGNEVLSSIGEAPFLLTASGPGTMVHTARNMGDGRTHLCYSATVAGSYTLSVRSSLASTPDCTAAVQLLIACFPPALVSAFLSTAAQITQVLESVPSRMESSLVASLH